MKRLATLLILAVVGLATYAQESQTAYNFLRLPVSAHAAALGGENISLIEDDASLIFSNPALLQSVSDKTIALNYMNYMKGANTASASFSRTAGEKATWAVSGQFMDYGKMKEVNADNIQTGEFSARDIAVAGYFSYLLGNNIAGGIAANFITLHIGDYNSIAVGVDLGVNYYDPDHELSLSATAKNLGGQLKAYDDQFEKMPLDLQVGLSKRFVGTPLRLSATLTDLTHWNYRFVNHLAVGADIILSEQFWIGAGYNFRRADEMKIQSSDNEESSHGAGLSFGAGVSLERFKLHVAYGKYHVSSSSILVNASLNI